MDTGQLAFVPWVRQGIATAIAVEDTRTSAMKGAVEVTAALSVNGAPPLSVPLRLRGPADVIGVHPHEIVRVDPRPGSVDFEPNYFPCIEFDRADFPWVFTPASAGIEARLRPWIVLVVVRKQLGVQIRPALEKRLPILAIGKPVRLAEELPDLDDSWAWAHAQTASPSDAPAVRAALGGPSELSLSRLLCPRVLEPRTDYVACVVPAFDLGRRAGVGETIKPEEVLATDALKPSWSAAAENVELPVYYMWEFRTGEGGDFQSLVELLHAEVAPARLGLRAFSIGRPGFELPPSFPADAVLDLEAALQPIDRAEPTTWSPATAQAFRSRLAAIVNLAGNSEILDPSARPLLAPPLYGRWHAGKMMAALNGVTWFDTLNLDPRHRVVAALGTRVVQEHQEALMASAWAQAGDLQQANERVRRLQLSAVVNGSLHARHFARLDEEAIVRVGTPAFGRVRTGPSGSATTLATMVASSALPLDAASAPMRRIGRQRGPLSRRIAQQGGVRALTRTWVGAFNVPFSAPGPAAIAGIGTFNVLLRSLPPATPLSSYTEITDAAIADAAGRPSFQIVAESQPVPVTPPGQPAGADNAAAQAFRAAARDHLARLNPGRLSFLVAPPPLAVASVRDLFLAGIHPARTIKLLVEAVITVGPQATPPTNPAADASPVDTIMAAPRFTQPMYEPLRDLGQDLLLPGLDAVGANVVLGLKTNRKFVEAYMVGLNVEMGRELLWRGYPTDQRATCFDQFWDARTSLQPRPDITPVQGWQDRGLGDAAGAPASEQFVMLLRSDLLRRYPNAIIYAVPALVQNGRRRPDEDSDKEIYPAFRGTLPPDVAFFGFDLTVDQVIGNAATGGYYIVIQEHAAEPRFGLDVGADTGGASHLHLKDGAPAGLALNGLTWGGTAAEMAAIVRQQPVRIAIHASRFVKKP